MVPDDRRYPWVVVAFLIVLYTLSFIDRQILGLLVAPIRHDLNISDTQFSLLAGFSFVIMFTFCGIPVGWIVDNTSRRMIIALGCAVWSLMTALCGVTSSFGGLFAARIGVGVGEAALNPAAYSLMSDYFKSGRLTTAISFYTLGVPLGSGLALMIGGAVTNALSSVHVSLPLIGSPRPWQVAFLAVGLPGLLLALMVPVVIKEPPRTEGLAHTAEQRPNIVAVLKYMSGQKWLYSGIILGGTFAAAFCYAANTWMPAFFMRAYGFTARDAGFFLGSSILFGGIPGAILAGWLADKLLERGRTDAHLLVGQIYVTGILVCGALGALVPIKGLSIALIAGFGFFSFTWTGVNAALLQLITPNRMRGQVSAIYLFIINLIGLGLGPTAVAVATDYLFKNDAAVGKSLGLVGIISTVLALLSLQVARKALKRSVMGTSPFRAASSA